ncbi:hypothetical protein ON010_g16359 [Phytophthora cinnamomi]|nr:hypothetical protein ON010_g16359 [Phytophthora cinnamomi]
MQGSDGGGVAIGNTGDEKVVAPNEYTAMGIAVIVMATRCMAGRMRLVTTKIAATNATPQTSRVRVWKHGRPLSFSNVPASTQPNGIDNNARNNVARPPGFAGKARSLFILARSTPTVINFAEHNPSGTCVEVTPAAARTTLVLRAKFQQHQLAQSAATGAPDTHDAPNSTGDIHARRGSLRDTVLENLMTKHFKNFGAGAGSDSRSIT